MTSTTLKTQDYSISTDKMFAAKERSSLIREHLPKLGVLFYAAVNQDKLSGFLEEVNWPNRKVVAVNDWIDGVKAGAPAEEPGFVLYHELEQPYVAAPAGCTVDELYDHNQSFSGLPILTTFLSAVAAVEVGEKIIVIRDGQNLIGSQGQCNEY